MLSNERILVTGCTGFIGSHVCEALIRLGASVVGIDNMDPYYARARKQHNLDAIRQSAKDEQFSFYQQDICDESATLDAIDSIDATGVIHLAAKAGVRPSIADPVGYAQTNVVGTQAVLSAASKAGCKRVVCASSSSVYGNSKKVPFGEADGVESPISPYAATKRSCELVGSTHHHLTKMPVAMLRFFTVFGPRQRPDLAISLFLSKINAGETINRFGDGSSSRDYTYIDDIVSGIISAYQRIDEHGYRIWNLGGDHPTTLLDLISTISSVVGKEAIIEEMGMQPGDVERTWADLDRAKSELSYQATTSIRAGIEKQWAWMQENASLIQL